MLLPLLPLHRVCPIKIHFHRRSRVTVAERQALAEDSEEAIRKKEIEAEERKKLSHDLVAESIRRELLESA
jgi:microfibrillar-associated protein 1